MRRNHPNFEKERKRTTIRGVGEDSKIEVIRAAAVWIAVDGKIRHTLTYGEGLNITCKIPECAAPELDLEEEAPSDPPSPEVRNMYL